MEYYISLGKEYLSLGVDNRMGVFWSDSGFNLLNEVVNHQTNLIESIKIKDEKGKDYSILQFFDKLKGLQIR